MHSIRKMGEVYHKQNEMYFLPSHLRSFFFYNKILMETEYEIVWKLHLYYDLYSFLFSTKDQGQLH